MKILRAAMALGVALAFGVGTADASFIAYLCNDVACTGGGDVVVTDQAGGDLNPVAGVINAQGVVGGLTTAVNVAQSKPAIGSAALPQLDLGFVATGIGEVWLYASDTGFTGVTPFTLQVGGTSTGSPISVDVSAGGASTNTNQTPGSPLLGSLGPFTGSPFTGSTVIGAVGESVNPYSLTLGVHIVQNGGTTTGDANLIAPGKGPNIVPEPTTALLLGLGLLGLGLVRRRRAR